MNLAGCAQEVERDASGYRESVSTTTTYKALGQVRVQTTTNGGHFTLRIADHGRGMKVEHIAEVGAYMQFERKIYEQQGSGLGLTIAKRLTELHGGDLNIQSEIGVGTTAEVTLPCLTLH